MTEIIVHRASTDTCENCIEGIKNYIKSGFGVELDLREKNNSVYMSHDEMESGAMFEDACRLCSGVSNMLALHIKEIKIVPKVLEFLEKFSIKNYFMYNTEGYDLTKFSNQIISAYYASDRPEKVNEKILWCDEYKTKWYDKEIIGSLNNKQKILYAVSIELFEDCTMEEIFQEWKRLIKFGFDGICTNYPNELKEFLETK